MARGSGSAARLVVFMHDSALSHRALGAMLTPPVGKAGVSAWVVRRALPSRPYREQLDAISLGQVPAGGWAPTARAVARARELLTRAEEFEETAAAVTPPEAANDDDQPHTLEDAARTLQRDERVAREVGPLPKATRQRWTRWQQLSLLH